MRACIYSLALNSTFCATHGTNNIIFYTKYRLYDRAHRYTKACYIYIDIAQEPFARNSYTVVVVLRCSLVAMVTYRVCEYGERTRNNVRNGARKILLTFFIWCLCTLDSLGSLIFPLPHALSRSLSLSVLRTQMCVCCVYRIFYRSHFVWNCAGLCSGHNDGERQYRGLIQK